MVGKASRKRSVPVVARRKIIPHVLMDINREYSFFGTKYFPHFHRPYLEICPIRAHKSLPNEGLHNHLNENHSGWTQENDFLCRWLGQLFNIYFFNFFSIFFFNFFFFQVFFFNFLIFFFFSKFSIFNFFLLNFQFFFSIFSFIFTFAMVSDSWPRSAPRM